MSDSRYQILLAGLSNASAGWGMPRGRRTEKRCSPSGHNPFRFFRGDPIETPPRTPPQGDPFADEARGGPGRVGLQARWRASGRGPRAAVERL